ncbi:MAG: hypothetical protein KKD05_04730 [Candidatus Omnitrophica bacterium]|nr:hypothetical protein [Candidatus Omnitrophota bacterium]
MANYTVKTIDFNLQVIEPLKYLFADILRFIPTLIKTAGIILIGWVIARIAMIVIKKFLIAMNFDKIAESTGITEVISEKKIGMTPSIWISKLFYYFGLFLTWIIALDALRLRLPSALLQDIGGFLSTLFMSLIILFIGLFLSTVISKFVEVTAKKLGIAQAGTQAGIIRWAIIIFTFIACLSRLGMPRDFLFIIMSALGITLCITFTIAFGIGSIPWIPKILDKMSKQ